MTLRKKRRDSEVKTRRTSSRREPVSKTKTSKTPGTDVKKVITGICRSTFMRVLKLQPAKQNPEKRTCGTAIIIPKEDQETVKKVKRAINAACKEKFGSDYNPWKSTKLKNPLKDGDVLLDDPDNKLGDEIEDAYLLNAKSYQLPQVVNKYAQPIEDLDELSKVCVSGYYFRFSLYFKASEVDTDEGGKVRVVNCYLNNIMFVKEGEALSSGSNAKDDFAEFAEESEDFEDDDDFEEDEEF